MRVLVSKLGAQVGVAPLTVLVNGHVVADRLRVPGGGDLPQTLTFAVPGFCLQGAGNVLEIRSGADATSMLWLYQVLLESVWDRDAAENALRALDAGEPALTYETRLGEDGGRWQPGPSLRLRVEQGGRAVLPSDLSWRGQDGCEGSAVFTAELDGFLGAYRQADGSWSQWRGDLIERADAFEAPGERFVTEVNWGHQWHDAGELDLFLEVGEQRTERAGWRDPSGRSVVVALTDDGLTFTGHAQNPHEGALGYRGRLITSGTEGEDPEDLDDDEDAAPPAGYRWLAATGGDVPEGAHPHGRDESGSPVWVARVSAFGGVHPAMAGPQFGGAVVAFGGSAHTIEDYEILMDEGIWVRDQDGEVPDDRAVVVGRERGGERLYAARTELVRANGVRVRLPGKLRPEFGGVNVAVDGGERVSPRYEVLVHPGVQGPFGAGRATACARSVAPEPADVRRSPTIC